MSFFKYNLRALVVLMVSLSFNVVFAGDWWEVYYECDAENKVFKFNRITKTVTYVGTHSGSGSIEAITYNSYNDIVYATDAGNFGTLSTTNGSWTFLSDPDSDGPLAGSLGNVSVTDIDGLAFDAWTGKIWASHRRGGLGNKDIIFQIDPTTNKVVRNAFGAGVDYIEAIGNSVYDDVDDLAVDPVTGDLYVAGVQNGGASQLLKLNKYTGDLVIATPLEYDDAEGMGFSNDGTLWISIGTGVQGDSIYFADITTGELTGFVYVDGSGIMDCDDIEAVCGMTATANIISGRVFNDANLNGTLNGGETGISGVKLRLFYDANNNGTYESGTDFYLQETTSNGSGDYQFQFAAVAKLIVSVDPSTIPSGFSFTTDNIETATFASNTFAETDVNNNFGLGSGADCDGDGLPDFYEGTVDTDGDGIQDRCDKDSDNDGILDSVEGTSDTDGDGRPDYRDKDSDNDGIPDALEVLYGIAPANYNPATGSLTITDTNNDGLDDALAPTGRTPVDFDGDGIPDHRDKDSDNDGILDIVEAQGVDIDKNGTVDGFIDANNDGYHDALTSTPLAVPNTDGASYETPFGRPLRADYVDTDADGDGVEDNTE